MTTIGLLHPGAMGAVLGSLLPDGSTWWVSAERSSASRARAEAAGLRDAGTLVELANAADVVLSVCPPESADDVAAEVAATGYAGIYVDANAVAPATARRIAARFTRFVDGGIVGPPPTEPGLTRLYLAGDEASAVAELFAGTAVETRLVDGEPGAASAVKMCFASWTKGTWALLLAIRALAEAEGVSASLLGEWATSMPELVARSESASKSVGPKAWRFEGEMREIAATFAEDGLPGDFHLGAAEIYRRLAPLKDRAEPSLAEALALLLDDRD
jgi:3-hydroxyisobutyrate dehydrogenase-like beta-hydroxyacid dehydrogenase